MTHRDDLIRMVELPSAEIEFRSSDDDGTVGTLYGYAARFNTPTRIDSWEGKFDETIMPGAFRDTLEKDGSKVKVLFNHGFDPSIGDKPLGKPAVQREDDRGLYVEVPLDDTSYNRDLVASLKSGALDGMSFRFSVIREDWDDEPDVPVRTLKQVRLFEYGPVTFPAYQATTAGVRARDAYQAWRTAHPISSEQEEPDDTSPTLEPVVEPDTSPTLEPVAVNTERWLRKADAMNRIVGAAMRSTAYDKG